MWDRQDLSRYLRTTSMLSAHCNLELPSLQSRVRFMTVEETSKLSETARRRNVFARHSRENSFYIQRIRELSDSTVIEVLRPGDPDDMLAEAKAVADLLERLAVLSSTFTLRRADLHRALAIASDRTSSVDVTIGRNFYYLRSSARTVSAPKGVPIDGRFTRRFDRCGFLGLMAACRLNGDTARRLEAASLWLFESRREPSDPAAAVKSAIALEALLGANGSEPITRALSERAAFILSRDHIVRSTISRAVREFYGVRSAVVHGRRGHKITLPVMLEGIDRAILLLCLTIAANLSSWPSTGALVTWCENQKWGAPATAVVRPFPGQYLAGALRLFGRAAKPREI